MALRFQFGAMRENIAQRANLHRFSGDTTPKWRGEKAYGRMGLIRVCDNGVAPLFSK
jgi:hypothetical protein